MSKKMKAWLKRNNPIEFAFLVALILAAGVIYLLLPKEKVD